MHLHGFVGNNLSGTTMFCQLILDPSPLIHHAEGARMFQDEQSGASVAVTGHDVVCSSFPHRLSRCSFLDLFQVNGSVLEASFGGALHHYYL